VYEVVWKRLCTYAHLNALQLEGSYGIGNPKRPGRHSRISCYVAEPLLCKTIRTLSPNLRHLHLAHAPLTDNICGAIATLETLTSLELPFYPSESSSAGVWSAARRSAEYIMRPSSLPWEPIQHPMLQIAKLVNLSRFSLHGQSGLAWLGVSEIVKLSALTAVDLGDLPLLSTSRIIQVRVEDLLDHEYSAILLSRLFSQIWQAHVILSC
jgi:hypothetical protein